jgi:hypothetical protein
LSIVLPVTSCKLFHKKDRWHNWSKLYYSWIKLILITMYKSSFLYSSEKYTTDIKCIYYTNRTYLFGSILVYGSFWFLSSAHVMKQEVSKGRNIFASNMTRQITFTSPNRKGNTTDMKIYNSRFLLISFLNFIIYQAKIMLCY